MVSSKSIPILSRCTHMQDASCASSAAHSFKMPVLSFPADDEYINIIIPSAMNNFTT